MNHRYCAVSAKCAGSQSRTSLTLLRTAARTARIVGGRRSTNAQTTLIAQRGRRFQVAVVGSGPSKTSSWEWPPRGAGLATLQSQLPLRLLLSWLRKTQELNNQAIDQSRAFQLWGVTTVGDHDKAEVR